MNFAKALIPILCLCALVPSVLFAQTPDQSQPVPIAAPVAFDSLQTAAIPPLRWYTPLENIPRAWGRWWNYTTRPEMFEQWATIAGLTVGLVMTDDATYTPSDRFYRSSPEAKKWSDFFAEFGDGRSQFALAGAFGAYGIVFKDDKSLRTGMQIVEVVIAAGGVVQVLKHVTGRESPFVRTSPTGIWKMFPDQVNYHRFVPYHDAYPSGHICTSIGTVIVIAENYPDVKWIRPVGYTLTALVGIGMANNGIHWYSDYPLGLFLGYYFGMIAAHPEGLPGEFLTSNEKVRIQVTPALIPDGAGVNLTVRF